MIIVRRALQPLGPTEVDTFRVPAGRTVGELLADHYHHAWPAGTKIAATLNGKRVQRADLDTTAPDGCCVTLAPNVAGIELSLTAIIVSALISTAISLAISYVFSLFGHKAKTPQRGDQESPTYSFDGVHTTSGAGFRIPIVIGQIKVGGNVVSSTLRTDNFDEYLEQVVVLNDGRIEAIGGITGGVRGEADGLGSLTGVPQRDVPADLTVNKNLLGNTECEVSLRMGEDLQSPMAGFDTVSTIVDVDAQLDDVGQSGQAPDLDETATSFSVRLQFTGGLYELLANGAAQAYPVQFTIWWTSPTAGSNAVVRTISDVHRSPFVKVLDLSEIPFVGTGPFTVIVRRDTPAGDPSFVVSSARFSKVITHRSEHLAYAGRACAGIRMRASEKVVEGQPQYGWIVKGSRVRAWDAVLGFTPFGWEVPTGSFAGIWSHPIGRNPAWALLFVLTCRAGGYKVAVENIDLPAFRDWADFCDEDVDGPDGLEARCQVDLSIDSGEKFGDAVRRILTAGRATLIRWGNRISIRYSYRDAHGRGSNTVPPRGGEDFDMPEAVIDTGAMDPGSFKLRRIDPRGRPNVIHFSILNEELGYEPDDIPVEDEEALQDSENLLIPTYPVRRRMDFRGLVRPSQVRREGTHLHRISRLSRWFCEFTTGPQGLPIWPGMILGVENDAARYHAGERHHGYRTADEKLAPTSSITLDHDVVITGAPLAMVAYLASPTGVVQFVTLTAGTHPAGTDIATSEPVTYQKGVSVTVGHALKTVKLFEVVGVGMTSDFRRKVQAIEWQPDAYDEASTDSQTFDGGDTASIWDQPTEEDAAMTGATAFRQPQGPDQLISIGRPPDQRSRKARVWTLEEDGWRLLTETLSENVAVPGLEPGKPRDVAVAIQDASGQYPSPQAASQFVVVAPEFGASATPSVQSLTATPTGRGLLLQWAGMDAGDFMHFEVRRGPSWLGGEIVGRPSTPFFYVEDVPISSGCTYQVCARFRGGLYSADPAQVTPSFPGLSHRLIVATLDAFAALEDGVMDGVEEDDGDLVLSEGEFRGTYTTPEIDPGLLSHFYWNVAVESEMREDWQLSDWESVPWSDLRWWRGYGREASSALPGVDFDQDLDAFYASARGTVGSHTRCKVEVRFHDGSTWGSWGAYSATWRYARKAQVRLTLDRRSVRYQVRVSRLAVTVHA